VPGVIAAVAPKTKAKARRTAATPATAPLSTDTTVFERLVAFAIEREAIRIRRASGQSPPWTTDPILAAGRVCNIRREDDKVSRWIATHWRDPHHDDPDVWFAMAAARFINEPDALAELGYPVPFDATRFRSVLEARQARGDKVYRTTAYKPPMPPRGTSITAHLTDYVLGPLWRDREVMRPLAGEMLAAYSDRLRERDRVGPFLAGQIVADLKAVAPLSEAADVWTFAVPGPGSERRLNRVRGRPLKASWSEAHWYTELMRLQAETAAPFAAAGLPSLDAQNMQNVLREFDKYERAREKGEPSRKYKSAATSTKSEPQPKTETVAPATAEQPPADNTEDGSSAETEADSESANYPHGERTTGDRLATYIYKNHLGQFYLLVEKKPATRQEAPAVSAIPLDWHAMGQGQAGRAEDSLSAAGATGGIGGSAGDAGAHSGRRKGCRHTGGAGVDRHHQFRGRQERQLDTRTEPLVSRRAAGFHPRGQ
jgi:hypothetical protein